MDKIKKCISLGRLETLSVECAEHLALHNGESIALDELTDLSTDGLYLSIIFAYLLR
jgi:hypothetical protein